MKHNSAARPTPSLRAQRSNPNPNHRSQTPPPSLRAQRGNPCHYHRSQANKPPVIASHREATRHCKRSEATSDLIQKAIAP
jgi:hypothetical protein